MWYWLGQEPDHPLLVPRYLQELSEEKTVMRYVVLVVLILLAIIAFWSTVGYVAWHFISKFW